VGRENKPEQDTVARGEDFLQRWSRRKLDAQHGDQGAPAGESSTAMDVAPAADEPEKVLTDADMPPIETLGEDSDYSPFLSAGVSDDLRQEAMHKLFTQPEFNITDGLNDYDEDYTQFAGLGSVITHEMKRMLQRELEKDRALSTADTEPPAEPRSPEAVVDIKDNNGNVESEPLDDPDDTDTKSSP